MARIFGTYWYNLDVPRHLVLFSPKTLLDFAEKAGFHVDALEFCSAGGILGSIQYVLRDTLGIRINLIHRAWLVMMVYPIEWIIDKLHAGDVFVLRAKK